MASGEKRHRAEADEEHGPTQDRARGHCISGGSSPGPGQIEHRATRDLNPNPRNARTHSRKQIRQIAESIKTFGFNNPILVDEASGVIAGHGRLQAAKELGLSDVPVVCLSHLSDAEKRAYILADNKIALNAGWDSALLFLELAELGDLLPDIDLGGVSKPCWCEGLKRAAA